MRIALALLAIVSTTFSSAVSDACCLTDRLYGRPVYAAGYAAYPAAPYAAGDAPYTVGYAPAQVVTPVAAPAPTTTSVLPPPSLPAPVQTSGVYQSQRPAYVDNPSVYTGLPVTSMRPPTNLPLRGTGPSGSYLGAANQYPSTYVAGYGAAQVPVTSPGLPMQITTPTGSPATALPTTATPPVFTPSPPPQRGLSRFFGSAFGTNYRTSYYRAPITYYRPVTTIDPVSGTTVTVQRPCTSYVQQLQRTPYNSLQLGHAAAPPASGQCQTVPTVPYGPVSTYGAVSPNGSGSPYGVGQMGGSIGPVGSGIGQVGGIAPSSPMTVPIPSTGSVPPMTPPTGAIAPQNYVPNTAPLTGSSPRGLSPAAPPATGDFAPVDRPSLNNGANSIPGEANRPPSSPPPSASPAPSSETGASSGSGATPSTSRSYWEMQDAENSSALRERNDFDRTASTTAPPRDPVSLGGRITGASPIQAPADYVSPFSQRDDSFEAPPLPQRNNPPARTYDASEMTSVSAPVSTPVREAALIRGRTYRSVKQSKPVQRDTNWYTVGP